MKRIYRLSNSNGKSIMVMADNEESIKRLALHFRVVKKLSCLSWKDITDQFPQYTLQSLMEVCNNAPNGMAGVEMNAKDYRWIVIDENGSKWYGCSSHFVGEL